MDYGENAGPLYFVERQPEGSAHWRVMGPNGVVGDFATVAGAQAKADDLNEQVAEALEDDA